MNNLFNLCNEGNKCEISRRDFAIRGGIVASGVSVMDTSSASSQSVQGKKKLALELLLLSWSKNVIFVKKNLDDSLGSERLAFKPEGYNFWEWRGHKIHYVVQGEGSPLVLIHGFGASVFHWRYLQSHLHALLISVGFKSTFYLISYEFELISVDFYRYNIPELAKKYKVYALDLLGFGWSDKALIEYDAMVWTDQVIDFMKEVVKEPAVVVGNR